jgi:hypothetical protein
MLQQSIEFFAECVVFSCGEITGGELLNRRDERLGYEPAAECAKVAACVWIASSEDRPID